jgi:DNA-binding transcriptional ArsR family regulator
MSPRRAKKSAKQGAHALLFAALGDETRLRLVAKLASGQPYSISQLAEGSRVTRQAVRKHLRVLENAGMVAGMRRGREHRFAFNPQPVEGIREYLDFVSAQWDEALGRLRTFLEK